MRVCVCVCLNICASVRSGLECCPEANPEARPPKRILYAIRTFFLYIRRVYVCIYVYNIRSVSSSIGVTGVRIQREIQKEREREERKTTNENGVGCCKRKILIRAGRLSPFWEEIDKKKF